jgi:hypothetical protein
MNTFGPENGYRNACAGGMPHVLQNSLWKKFKGMGTRNKVINLIDHFESK